MVQENISNKKYQILVLKFTTNFTQLINDLISELGASKVTLNKSLVPELLISNLATTLDFVKHNQFVTALLSLNELAKFDNSTIRKYIPILKNKLQSFIASF